MQDLDPAFHLHASPYPQTNFLPYLIFFFISPHLFFRSFKGYISVKKDLFISVETNDWSKPMMEFKSPICNHKVNVSPSKHFEAALAQTLSAVDCIPIEGKIFNGN
jgi:hypothetical protein